ncbi:hypothetical protein [Streptomyces sp. NPDC007088]|uniref:hypothetical protein n=1 Tax=Streptomyces sp. NPDC007088 TaxID=3364773 RepID=UPI0036A9B3FD
METTDGFGGRRRCGVPRIGTHAHDAVRTTGRSGEESSRPARELPSAEPESKKKGE